jgi:hypothetical protein
MNFEKNGKNGKRKAKAGLGKVDKMLSEVRDVLNSIIDMHQLNFELLEELNVACKWLLQNKVEIPNREKFVSLLNKADSLIEELSLESPQFSIRRKVTNPKSDGEVTEPEYESPNSKASSSKTQESQRFQKTHSATSLSLWHLRP